ncbi:MAG: RNA polymerase sigma factor [Pseudoalteromonas prydzensis]|uniref:RNA polymerase sigma factor n=1 Tax=Pseudoalteromonas prydzensis TaxID=182141 RepID=UPI003F9A2F30
MYLSVKNKKSLQLHAENLTGSIEGYRREVNRFLTRRVGCADTAADIFQSVAENLLRRDPDPPIKDVRAFLYRAVKNAAFNLQRSERTRAELNVLLAPIMEEWDERSPENIIESTENVQKVEQIIQSLPVLTRQIFIMYRLHGINQKDIAEQMGVSLSTVEKHVKKALSLCFSCLYE